CQKVEQAINRSPIARADQRMSPFAIVSSLRNLSGDVRSNCGAVHMRRKITMKRWCARAIGLLLIACSTFWHSHQAFSQADAGWVTLFDGSSLDNWSQIGNANWKLEDGVVQADKGNGFLVSKNSYADFQIRAEFWVDDD